MRRIRKLGVLAAVLCLSAAVVHWVNQGVTTSTSFAAQDSTADRPVWVGVLVEIPNQEEPDYLIGTVPKSIFYEVELDRYRRRFIRISDLRIEQTTDAEGQNVYHLDCRDEYDWGIILVRYEDIISMELKRGDPLRVSRARSAW